MKGLVIALMVLPAGAMAGSVVANRTLPAGTVITAQDVVVDPDKTGGPDSISQVVGQQLRVMAYQGRTINLSHLTAPILVDRNQIVTIAYEKSALRIEAEGRALSAGSAGETIRVMNNGSRVTVYGRVAEDGTVIIEQN